MAEAHDITNEHPEPETPAPQGENFQKFVGNLEQASQAVATLSRQLKEEGFLEKLIAVLSGDPNFIRLTYHLAREAAAEFMIARQEGHDHHAAEMPLELLGAVVFGASIVDSEDALFRACITDNTHPTEPNSVQVFYKRAEWVPVSLDDNAKQKIKQALEQAEVKPYRFHSIELSIITTKKVDDSSVPIGSAVVMREDDDNP